MGAGKLRAMAVDDETWERVEATVQSSLRRQARDERRAAEAEKHQVNRPHPDSRATEIVAPAGT